MSIHREPNATLTGEKILIVCDSIKKGPSRLATRGRHNGQFMVVEGDQKPAFAIIDFKLRYLKER